MLWIFGPIFMRTCPSIWGVLSTLKILNFSFTTSHYSSASAHWNTLRKNPQRRRYLSWFPLYLARVAKKDASEKVSETWKIPESSSPPTPGFAWTVEWPTRQRGAKRRGREKGRQKEESRRANERLFAHRLMDSGANLTVGGSGHVGLFFFRLQSRGEGARGGGPCHPGEPPPTADCQEPLNIASAVWKGCCNDERAVLQRPERFRIGMRESAGATRDQRTKKRGLTRPTGG